MMVNYVLSQKIVLVFFDSNLNKINKKVHIVSDDENTSDKGDYKKFYVQRDI